jgi:hypothetical protein
MSETAVSGAHRSEASAHAAGPAPLPAVLGVTFLGSVTGGVFWVGIFFVTLEHYRFSAIRNLGLALVMGAVYALVARGTGRILAVLTRTRGPRRVLAGALGVWGLAAALPLLSPAREWLIWASALIGAGASGLVWPVVESYLGAGRHGAELRRALGWFNITWTSATALPLLILPCLSGIHPLSALALCALMNGGAMLSLLLLPQRPGTIHAETAGAAVGKEYPLLLACARWLLPLSYLMSSTLAPVLPHRLQALGETALPESMIAAVWMVARFLTLAVMARVTGWHGRWGALFAGAASLAGGLALVLLAPALPAVVAGLALFGVGMGITYYASLYYSLSVGHAAVDAGGDFEALVGVGYVLGPIVGLAGRSAAGVGHGAVGTVMAASLVSALGGLLALQPYLAARRARRS